MPSALEQEIEIFLKKPPFKAISTELKFTLSIHVPKFFVLIK